MTSYRMRRKRVPRKIRRSTKLHRVQRSPELFVRSMNFSVPKTLISPAQSTFGKEKLVFPRFPVPIKVVLVKNNYFLHPKFELHRCQQMNVSVLAQSLLKKNIAHILVTNSLFG